MRGSASALFSRYDDATARDDLDTYQKGKRAQPPILSLYSELYHDPAFELSSLSLVIRISLFRALNTRSYPLANLRKILFSTGS